MPGVFIRGVLVGFGAAALLAGARAWAMRARRRKRVYVSGCFDLLHSGHVAFFKEAAQLGELHVAVGNDACIMQLKKRPMFPEDERVYMVGAIRWVKHAFVAKGMGHDQAADLDAVQPDIYFVNQDGDRAINRQQCAERGIEYIVAARTPDAGLAERSSTSIKAGL
jgi:cytidyltransferase-like protein